jgi:LysR family hca operon transcriptional activator
MELRHLRFFIAVAEEGRLTLAAERRLHTAQPSLSRQIRDLETEVGAQLLVRSVRGIELTAAGQAFLDHARLSLSQVEAAGEAARRAAQPAKTSFVMGFLIGTDMNWFPEAVRLLRDELPSVEVILVTQKSPELTSALLRRKIDVAVLRPEPGLSNLAFKHLMTEPLVAVLPSDHRLAAFEIRGGSGLFCRNLPIAVPAFVFRVMRSCPSQQAGGLSRSLHGRCAHPAVASRPSAADGAGG